MQFAWVRAFLRYVTCRRRVIKTLPCIAVMKSSWPLVGYATQTQSSKLRKALTHLPPWRADVCPYSCFTASVNGAGQCDWHPQCAAGLPPTRRLRGNLPLLAGCIKSAQYVPIEDHPLQRAVTPTPPAKSVRTNWWKITTVFFLMSSCHGATSTSTMARGNPPRGHHHHHPGFVSQDEIHLVKLDTKRDFTYVTDFDGFPRNGSRPRAWSWGFQPRFW